MKNLRLKLGSFSYETNQLVLQTIDLNLLAGQLVFILGKTKAGKSTLCQLLAGLIPTIVGGSFIGELLVDKVPQNKIPWKIWRQKIGVVLQDPQLQLTGAVKTTAEELAFGLESLNLSRAQLEQRVSSLLQLFGLEKLATRDPFELSGGQQQKLALASALIHQPEILILDDPFAQLDPQSQMDLLDQLQKSKKQGALIFIAGSNCDLAAEYADQLIILDQHTVIFQGSPQIGFNTLDLSAHGLSEPLVLTVAKKLRLQTATKIFPTKLKDLKRLFANVTS